VAKEKPLLSIQNVKKVFKTRDGELEALGDVSFDVHPGEFVSIVGPSGCGKTTLLKSFNRFLELNEAVQLRGSVLIDGQDIYAQGKDVIEIRKKAGLLAQRPYPLPMSIFDNVAYGLRIHSMCRKSHLSGRVKHYLEIAGLWEEVNYRLHAPAADLSIGQQQRLCIARALAVQPEVLLMDEPTSALDPISTGKIEELAVELKEKYTIAIVTHNMQQALRISDTTAFFLLGEVIESGETKNLFTMPQDKRTEDYITGRFG